MISIRNFTNQDFEKVVEFYSRAYNGDLGRKIEAFNWIQNSNPFRNPRNNYVLISVDGRLAGYWGLMPVMLYYFGKPFLSLISQETLVDPTFRGRALATRLLEEVNNSNHFIYSIWHNEKILAIKKRGGWSNIGLFQPLKKIFKVDNIIKLRTASNIIQKGVTYFSRPYFALKKQDKRASRNCTIEHIEHFTPEFDEFFNTQASKFSLISDRCAATLNWKYTDIPHKKYEILVARINGNVSGYAAIRIENQDMGIRKGIIVDVLANPDEPEALSSLVKKCDEIFNANDVDFSACLVIPEDFRKVFKEHGYFQARKRPTSSLLGYNLENTPDRDAVMNMNNWYLTYGESDGDMW